MRGRTYELGPFHSLNHPEVGDYHSDTVKEGMHLRVRFLPLSRCTEAIPIYSDSAGDSEHVKWIKSQRKLIPSDGKSLVIPSKGQVEWPQNHTNPAGQLSTKD